MDLVCVDDNGELLSMEDALGKEVDQMIGLFSDAFEVCRQRQPDTLETVLVEKAFRIAFANFKGEMHVKRYLLTRQLDKRTHGTPRAQMMASAMRIGGPQALIAVFYATQDTHRNLESRKTFRLLDEVLTEESREHLYRRASQFPANPAFNKWFEGLLEKLDVNALALAFLLRCLRASVVPGVLFKRCHEPSRRWGADGEICLEASKLPPVIRDRSSFESAMENLELMGLAKVDSETIRVNQHLAEIFQDRPEIPTWKARAVQLLSHILPTHSVLEPENYVTLHETMLPLLRNILPYLREPQVVSFLGRVSGSGLQEAVELCMATSFFSDHKWKEEVMALATSLLQTIYQSGFQSSAVLMYRFQIRQLRYAMLRTPGVIDSEIVNIEFPRGTANANGWSADLLLLRVHDCIKRNEFEAAHSQLSLYSSIFGSTLERTQGARIDAARGVVHRYQGQFRDAYDILSKVESPNSVILAHLCAVMCEMGEFDMVSAMTSPWLQHCSCPQSKAAMRIRLASINAELMGGLQHIVSGDPWPSWPRVHAMYEDLQSYGQLSWFERMTILIGIAITQHVGGQIRAAELAWNEVRLAYVKFGLVGYIGRVIDWSICELELRQGVQQINILERLADMQNSTWREYFFTGLGTVWPAIIRRLLLNYGISI
ncbi:hypothetical protein ANO14919_104760 [Xylariales sp. No.14919]|nr:hypothetical protein ANO14919_104760 [Xylariales sp. No.14919]